MDEPDGSNIPPVDALDTPINRATIDQLPIEALDAWLSEVRDRRLVVVNRLQNVREAKKKAYRSDVMEKYAKLYERTRNAITKLDEQVEKVETYINKLRAMELELSDDGEAE